MASTRHIRGGQRPTAQNGQPLSRPYVYRGRQRQADEPVSRETSPEHVCHRETDPEDGLYCQACEGDAPEDEDEAPPGGIPSIGLDQEVSKANYLA